MVINYSGGNERHLVGTDRDPVPMCIAFCKALLLYCSWLCFVCLRVRTKLGSIPGRGKYKNLCRRRESSDYVSFCKGVKRQRFHTLHTHDANPRTTQQHSVQTPYTLELDLSPFPPYVAHFIPNDL